MSWPPSRPGPQVAEPGEDPVTTAATDPPRTDPTGRPALPSRATTVVVTVLFGLFGLIPAAIHGSRAEQLGGSRRPYWVAFGLGMVVSIVVFAVVVVGGLALLRSSAGTAAPSAPAAPQSTELGTWADAPAVGSCFEGVLESRDVLGGVGVFGPHGEAYRPIDCAEPVAFFEVSGVLDGVVRRESDPSLCTQFGPVYASAWYSAGGVFGEGPADSAGHLVCLERR